MTSIRTGANRLLLIALLAAVIPLLSTSDAAASPNPCPSYAIDDVHADRQNDWDKDRISNHNEIYVTGTNPCTPDVGYCLKYPNDCLPAPASSSCPKGHLFWHALHADPHGDWDHDGYTNTYEIHNGANPCKKPCPNFTYADVLLDPFGAWDSDNQTNLLEWQRGTNPCNGREYNPCPAWSQYQVDYMPGLDWDNDGTSNSVEVKAGTSPCHRAPKVVVNQVTTTRLPHVTQIVPTPTPVVSATTCPPGYPYFHAGNGLCYANPVGRNR